MSTVFFTGDRSDSPVYVPLVLISLLREVAADNEIATGVNGGVEGLVRDVAERAGLQVKVMEQDTLPNGKPDWDKRSMMLMHPSSGVSRILAFHVDPHASSVVKSLLNHADAKTELVTAAELLT